MHAKLGAQNWKRRIVVQQSGDKGEVVIDILQMRSVVAIVDTGSFTKAAEILFVSPQTVKNLIDALELELGVRLFLRSKKGTIPTTEGHYIYERSKKIIEATEKMISGVSSLVGREGIALACPRSRYQSLCDRICSDFLALHPEIDFRYVLYDEFSDLLDCLLVGKANVAFCAQLFGESLSDDFVFHVCPSIPPIHYCVVVHQDDPLASFEHIAPHMLLGRQTLFTRKNAYLPEALEPYVNKSHTLDEMYEIINYCLGGGVCVDWDFGPITHQRLSRVPLDLSPEAVCIMTRVDPVDSVKALVQHFVDWKPSDDDKEYYRTHYPNI